MAELMPRANTVHFLPLPHPTLPGPLWSLRLKICLSAFIKCGWDFKGASRWSTFWSPISYQDDFSVKKLSNLPNFQKLKKVCVIQYFLNNVVEGNVYYFIELHKSYPCLLFYRTVMVSNETLFMHTWICLSILNIIADFIAGKPC